MRTLHLERKSNQWKRSICIENWRTRAFCLHRNVLANKNFCIVRSLQSEIRTMVWERGTGYLLQRLREEYLRDEGWNLLTSQRIPYNRFRAIFAEVLNQNVPYTCTTVQNSHIFLGFNLDNIILLKNKNERSWKNLWRRKCVWRGIFWYNMDCPTRSQHVGVDIFYGVKISHGNIGDFFISIFIDIVFSLWKRGGRGITFVNTMKSYKSHTVTDKAID